MRLSVKIAAGLALVGSLLLVTAARGMPLTLACLWDYDTLKAEAKGLPGIAEILTGRIERNPPRYYEMRLERVTRELAADPSRLDLYDDASVACDRLGRSDDAIEWMAKKRTVLNGLDVTKPEIHVQEYRFHANLGTFHAHRWVRAGRPRDRLDDLQDAEREIARAIEINPEAHFGREKYQLAAIRWLIELPQGYMQPTFLQLMPRADSTAPNSKWSNAELEDAIKGISGLMVLGNAWESVDVVWALEACLSAHEDGSLAYVARLRVQELLADGKESFHPAFVEDEWWYREAGFGGEPQSTEDVCTYFADARASAKEWALAREAYMQARFAKGEHPDTTPTFWSEWKDEPKPTALPDNALMRPETKAGFAIGVVILVIGFVLWRYVSWAVRILRM